MSEAIQRLAERLAAEIKGLEKRLADARACQASINEVLGVRCEQAPDAPGLKGKPAPPANNGNKFYTPLSAGGLEIGLALPQPFGATDLESRLDGDEAAKRAYQFLAAWKRRGWLVESGFRQYRRHQNFGGRS